MSRTHKARTASWVVIAIVCVVFSPYALLATWHLVTPGAVHPTAVLLVHGVDLDFAAGGGEHSAAFTTDRAYARNLAAMIVHSVSGGLLLLLGPTQFSSWLRRTRPGLHRRFGMAYLSLAAATSVAAMVYLLRTRPTEVLSGPVFALQLWLLAFGTLGSGALALAAIRRGDVMVHQRLMALNFGLILATPAQRIDWVAIGNLAPSIRLPEANLLTLMHLGPLVILGSVVASRTLDRRKHMPGVTGPIVHRRLLAALQLVGLVCLAVLMRTAFGLGAMGSMWLRSFVPFLLTFWVAVGFMESRARQRGDDLGASEWGVHLAALAVTPTLVLALFYILRLASTDISALCAAVVLVWPAAHYTASLTVAGRLYRAVKRVDALAARIAARSSVAY